MISLIILFILLILIIGFFRKSPPELHSHWNTLIDNCKYSPKEFYTILEKELRTQGVENISIREKNISIGGRLSAKRVYLRISWKEYTYDCCCAPFGNGTFVSWWLYSEKTGMERVLSRIPAIGGVLARIFYPITFYTSDTASMFMTYAQSSVLKVIEDVTKGTGYKLSDEKSKPIMKDIFKR